MGKIRLVRARANNKSWPQITSQRTHKRTDTHGHGISKLLQQTKEWKQLHTELKWIMYQCVIMVWSRVIRCSGWGRARGGKVKGRQGSGIGHCERQCLCIRGLPGRLNAAVQMWGGPLARGTSRRALAGRLQWGTSCAVSPVYSSGSLSSPGPVGHVTVTW